MSLDRTTAVKDTGDLILVDVFSPEGAARIARRYASQIRDALAFVNRPRTVVRLRANLATRYEEADYYLRDIPPGTMSTSPKSAIAKSSTRRPGRIEESAT
jgi:hypothetical protein